MEFLDYGGGELVSLSAVKYLPEECKSLPFQAIKASLYGNIDLRLIRKWKLGHTIQPLIVAVNM